MEVEVISTYQEINDLNLKNKIVVAIDTFRATSTIITALNYNIERIYPVEDIKEAKQFIEDNSYIVAGERDGKKIPDFDLGNSPRSYKSNLLAAKRLVLTTTNGSKLLKRLVGADNIYVASLLNQTAIAMLLNQQQKDIIFCCAGNRGEFSLEDFLTAGAIITKLKIEDDDILSDKAIAAREIYIAQKNNLSDFLKTTASGKNLINLGKEADIDFIVSKRFELVPYYDNKKIEELSS